MRSVLIVTFVIGFLLGLGFGTGSRPTAAERQADAPSSVAPSTHRAAPSAASAASDAI
jgi:hypothetical protein